MKALTITAAVLGTVAVASGQWSFQLDTSFRTSIVQRNLNSLIELDDGKIFASGLIRYQFNAQAISPWPSAEVVRGSDCDVQPTPDGGFIAVGVALAVAGQYTQDVWVVKTDSMGCIEPGCHLVTGVEIQITNLKNALRVWPNPVARGGSVQVSIDLPLNFQPQGALRLSVVSSEGRLVHEQSLPDNNSMYHLNANLSAGIYHIHLSDASRWISGAKLVVE